MPTDSAVYTPPSWMDKEFLQNGLRKGLKDEKLQIHEYSLQLATGKGDNFLSQLLRARIVLTKTNEKKQENFFIVKCLPKGDFALDFVNEMQFFKKEEDMLLYTLPVMRNILEKAGFPKLFADLYYCQRDPCNVLIMEDLRQGGYQPADRLEGLDLAHAILALESLALFHATSLVAIEKDPSIKTRHNILYWSPVSEKHIKKSIDEAVRIIAGWPDLPDGLSKKLEKFEREGLPKMWKAAGFEEKQFNVLTHGDTWTNNFMFKYENDVPVALKFVDFQNSCYNNPATDLLYFIASSPKNEIKIKCIDLFLKTYHEKLIDSCEKLNYNINFTLKELKDSFIQRLAFGFMVGTVVYPYTTAPSKDVVDLDDYMQNPEDISSATNIYSSEKFQIGMKLMLPYFLENGVFD